MYYETAEKLLEFIRKSPTAFHAVDTIEKNTGRQWLSGAFRKRTVEPDPRRKLYGYKKQFSADRFFHSGKSAVQLSHYGKSQRFPTLKIKENPEITVENAYVKLNVEKYGGMLMSPWFYRPLSVAGRVVVRENGELKEKLVDIDKKSPYDSQSCHFI